MRIQRQFGDFMRLISKQKHGKRAIFLLFASIISSFIMWLACVSTDSMALTAFSYLSMFNILRLFCCFVSMWVQKQHPNFSFSFGYERFEVLAVFVCTTLTQLGGFFIFKESIEGLIHQHRHHEVSHDSQLTVVILGCVMNFLVTYAVENKPFASILREANSNFIQDTIFDMGTSICTSIPILSKFMLLRTNPFILLCNLSGATVLLSSFLMQYKDSQESDIFASIFITGMTIVTMFPLSLHCSFILMEASTKGIRTSIDKCLKEANTLDGFLEFRQEHIWTVSFGKYAGSFHVRIRRDANEQLVLAQLTNTLSPYLHSITIQMIKDDWKTPVQIAAVSPGYEVRRDDSYYKKGDSFTVDIAGKKQTESLPKATNTHYNKQDNSYDSAYKTPTSEYNKQFNSATKYSGPKISIDFD